MNTYTLALYLGVWLGVLFHYIVGSILGAIFEMIELNKKQKWYNSLDDEDYAAVMLYQREYEKHKRGY